MPIYFMFNNINLAFADFLKSEEFFEYPILDEKTDHSKVPLTSNAESQQMQPSDYLVAFSTRKSSYCIGCVDMVNSTKISSRLLQNDLSQYYEIFLNSMSRIIGGFGGRVIKNIGDCLLYYFPESTNSKKPNLQNYLECGLVMIEAQPMISKLLESKGLPRLDYRVSEDHGPVIIMSTTDSTSLDLIGPPVNICAKINTHASKNEFVVGGDLKEITKKIDGYTFEQIHGFNSGLNQTYAVFKVNRK